MVGGFGGDIVIVIAGQENCSVGFVDNVGGGVG